MEIEKLIVQIADETNYYARIKKNPSSKKKKKMQ